MADTPSVPAKRIIILFIDTITMLDESIDTISDIPLVHEFIITLKSRLGFVK